MRRSLFLLVLLFVICACSRQEQTPEEQAGIAAKGYYDSLLTGDFEGFLSGKAGMDSVPGDYRAQMMKACEKYRQELEQLRGGLATVTISNAKLDSTQQLMHAFLLLHFKDSVKEEITVPMVQLDGQWKMR